MVKHCRPLSSVAAAVLQLLAVVPTSGAANERCGVRCRDGLEVYGAAVLAWEIERCDGLESVC